MDGEIGRVVPYADGPILDPGTAVPDLEEPPRADRRGTSSDRGAPRPRRTRGGTPVSFRRRAARRRRSGSRGRPGELRAGGRCRPWPIGRFASARLSGSVLLFIVDIRLPLPAPGTLPPGNQERPSSSRDERSCLPRCHPHSAIAALPDRRATRRELPIGAALYRWRSAPEPTCVRTVTRRVRRSVRRLPGPFAAAVVPISTSHRVSLPTLDGYSSRSSPIFGSDAESRRRARGASSGGRSLDVRAPRYRGAVAVEEAAWPRWTRSRHRRSLSSGA